MKYQDDIIFVVFVFLYRRNNVRFEIVLPVCRVNYVVCYAFINKMGHFLLYLGIPVSSMRRYSQPLPILLLMSLIIFYLLKILLASRGRGREKGRLGSRLPREPRACCRA